MAKVDWIVPDSNDVYANDRQHEVVEYLMQLNANPAVRLMPDGDIELRFVSSQYTGLAKYVVGKTEKTNIDPYRVGAVYVPESSEVSLKIRLTVDEDKLDDS